MKKLLKRVNWFRALTIVPVLFVFALLPKHANAQCGITYADIVADDTNVYAYAGVIDTTYNCYPQMYGYPYGFWHSYGAGVMITSPGGRQAGASNYSQAFMGGGGVEAGQLLGIGGEFGVYSLANSVGIGCSVAGGLYGDSQPRNVQVNPPFSLEPQAISFLNDIPILKDRSDIEDAPPINDPVWTSSVNEPVAYVKGDTMRVTVQFGVVNPPASAVGDVTIEGVIDGLGTFRQTGVTIPSSGTVSISDVDLDAALPSTGTQFYNPMTINWQHTRNGATTFDGSTQHKVYVTFATPVSSPVVLTPLHLAVSQAGATTLQEAFDHTWAYFTSQNIGNYSVNPLFYYGADFDNTAVCFPGDNGVPMLIRLNRAGQCTCFAELLLGALRANGIGATGTVSAVRQRVVPTGATRMLVAMWTFNGAGSLPDFPPFTWAMDFPNGKTDEMQIQPDLGIPPGGVYGQLTSNTGLAGQNTATPQEKVFGNHVFVKTTGITGGPYFDPSYGVVYTSPTNFEENALHGWAIRVDTDDDNRLRARQKGDGTSIVFQ